MATVAELAVPADAFPLGSVFSAFPNVTVELERVVPTNHAVIPYFWVKGAGEATEAEIEAAFDQHPEVERVALVDEVEGEYLLRVEWRPDYRGVLKAISETSVTILSAVGVADRWTFEVRGETRQDIADCQEHCQQLGIPVEVAALHSLASVESGPEYDLTDAQREALLLAYERGYFDSPRTTTLADIATELDITRQSLSSRLRRGHKRLIRNALVDA